MAVLPAPSGVLVLGAGGHGKVVADTLLSQGAPVRAFLDDSPGTWGDYVLGIPVLGAIDRWSDPTPDGLVSGVGSNMARRRVVERLGAAAAPLWRNAVHPRATVSPRAALGCDVVIVAGAVVNAGAAIGSHVIINTSASVDHDCVVGDYAHVAPGAHLAGGVVVGEGALVGVGAVVAPGCSVGRWAVVGAGTVVVRDIPDGVTAKGVPARW